VGRAWPECGTRLQGFFVWEMLDFVINATLFVLVGLELREVVNQLGTWPPARLAVYAVAISATAIAVRFVWLFTVRYVIRAPDRRPIRRARRVGWRPRLAIAWSGMRGSVSLAAALALPLTTHSGERFPDRNMIIFLTFAVIFATRGVQGLTLPALIRRLGVARDGSEDTAEIRARLMATKAALAHLDELEHEDSTREDTIKRMGAPTSTASAAYDARGQDRGRRV